MWHARAVSGYSRSRCQRDPPCCGRRRFPVGEQPMRIKRIEVHGFKSFNDRAVLHINEPITAVVGPNGCGKSNIVDAIRWCMGEQSAKHLRGKAMDDVIFAGSESRGPAAMAEVSLTFDEVGFSHEALALALSQADDMDDPVLAAAETEAVAEA